MSGTTKLSQTQTPGGTSKSHGRREPGGVPSRRWSWSNGLQSPSPRRKHVSPAGLRKDPTWRKVFPLRLRFSLLVTQHPEGRVSGDSIGCDSWGSAAGSELLRALWHLRARDRDDPVPETLHRTWPTLPHQGPPCRTTALQERGSGSLERAEIIQEFCAQIRLFGDAPPAARRAPVTPAPLRCCD